MGLPGFFAWLLKQYKESNIIIPNLEKQCDILYLDANCLFHPQCYKVLELCKSMKDIEKLEKLMFMRIINYIDYLIGYTNPQKEVVISVDGVAPMAKINQQRKRRYRSIDDTIIKNKIKEKHDIEIENNIWNNTCITPGTVFMEKLHKEIIQHIEKKNKKGKIIYTYLSYHVPGEGEHKILKYIKSKTQEDEIHVIYGLDADLIFLSLASQKNNIYLLREAAQLSQIHAENLDDNKGINKRDPILDVAEELKYVSIDKTKRCLGEQLELNIQKRTNGNIIDSITDHNLIQFSNDFIFICYFLGNDFLPHLPSIDIKKYGLDMIIECYVDTYLTTKCHIIEKIKPKITINMIFLQYFLTALAEIENDYFINIIPEMDNYLKRKKCYANDDYSIELWKLENMKLNKVKDTIQLGSDSPEQWKFRYYEHYFGIAEHQQEHIDELCYMYLEGIAWVTKYYFEGCPSWEWQYIFTHTPFLSDIVEYLKKNKKFDINNIKFNISKPLDPCVQLLAVLPPGCNKLLPNSYQYLVTSPKSPIIDMFPSKIELDMMNKDMFWQCVPMIPPLDIKRILKTVNKLVLTESEKIRNIITDNI
ncbi:MAG: XRN 5'-3' exonuclease [Edafosvirus sp.]|uniref:XRN 5'-3' exonuclease n=1 Tax=Edafosvirus sp. TaxID=2487765 RepID=A0A3G4ZVB6_9VIRU|nr:MAG: XRN 5'-3' exonuclease [Edafosvirus sp.]